MRIRLDYITNSSSSSYLISVSNEQKLSESERAILNFILNAEDEYESEKAELIENNNKKIYRKEIDYESGLGNLLDKFPKDKVDFKIDDDYC